MATRMILVGDVNLMNLAAGEAPFALAGAELGKAGIVFANLECCLYRPPGGPIVEHEGFFANPELAGAALKEAAIAAVGIANNVNYGEAAILSSIARLDEIGIAHAGAGANRAAARAPAIVGREGLRFGFLQRSSVYWPTNHEAGETAAGIAVIRAHTAYQVPMHKTRPEIPPLNRPGIPPEIITWADPASLQAFRDDIAALRKTADVVIASCHWGLFEEVLAYMREIAHAAIDAGADIVIGHGPHYSLPMELYKSKPIFYGLGSFSFHTGHHGRRHGDWLGMMAKLDWDGTRLARAAIQFVRHDAENRTVPRSVGEETTAFERLAAESGRFGARLTAEGAEAGIALSG